MSHMFNCIAVKLSRVNFKYNFTFNLINLLSAVSHPVTMSGPKMAKDEFNSLQRIMFTIL